MAKDARPGQRNNLDALCRHFGIDNARRTLHGALLDAELLAEVYMAMTRGQESLMMDLRQPLQVLDSQGAMPRTGVLKVLEANETELAAHVEYVSSLTKAGAEFW